MTDKNQPNECVTSRPNCPTCEGKVEGRADKVFCDIPCKNKHHSDVRRLFKSRTDHTFKNIRRNIVLIEGILGKESNKMRIHRDVLFSHGFELEKCTRAFKKGKDLIWEIGDYQCCVFKNGIVELTRMVELSEFMPGYFERWLVDFPKEWKIKGVTVGLDSDVTGRFDE
jgi:hypothetical protein